MIKNKKILVAEEMPEVQASIDAMPAENRIFVDKSLEIADYIFRVMEEKGMLQKDLADKMGKSEAEISKILGGMQNLTLRTIAKLEAALESTLVCTPVHFHFAGTDGTNEKLKDVISGTQAKASPKMNYEKEECRVVSIFGPKKKHDHNNPLPKAI
jgi:transcriptional regulator with XRE-family HTH domain